ncbi:MAG TPA: HNH endonuclease [Gallicola sp.]|nr:HNH endonuclease [Gallicola sp.]
MIVEQDFKVKVNKKNIEWYLSKGYLCNLKDEILVNVRDLIKNTHTKVSYECDNCGKIKSISFSSFNQRHNINEKTYCVKCANEIRINNSQNSYATEIGYKICRKCGRKLLLNSDYYFKNNRYRDGFENKCKECFGNSFTSKLMNIPKEGYKFCVKCNRELPVEIKYFPPDKVCSDGFRNICRECGRDGHFMKDDYVKKKQWTKDEEELLKQIYPYYTNDELIELYFPDATKISLENKAYKLNVSFKQEDVKKKTYKIVSKKLSGKNSPYYGVEKSKDTKDKISKALKDYYSKNNGWWLGKKRSEKQRRAISERMKGKWSGKNNPRYSNPLIGKDNPNWKGGITPLYFELRSEIKEWQNKSMESCNYKCVLTGKDFDNIHHLYPFKDIVDEVFKSLNLDIKKKVNDYTEEEFKNIKEKLIELHNFYGYGVCLCKDLHKLFHDTYGYTQNTPNQFYEFKERYSNGEFNYLLKTKYKNIME